MLQWNVTRVSACQGGALVNTQPRLFVDAWPWTPTPARPRCNRCLGPTLADPYDPLVVWCSASVEPRLTPDREAELRAERAPRPVRRRPSVGGVL